MRCKHCNAKYDDLSLWCPECGTASGLLKTDLSAIRCIKETWGNYQKQEHKPYPFAVFSLLLFILPLSIAYWFSVKIDVSTTPFINYLLDSAIYIILAAFALVPFTAIAEAEELSIRSYGKALKHYPTWLFFSFVGWFGLFAFKYICIGDPILNLVRLVLVLYWFAIIIPVPGLIAVEKKSVLGALKIAYKQGADTRWQQFNLFFLLLTTNIILALPANLVLHGKVGMGLLILGVPLFLLMLISLPISYLAIMDYYKRMYTHEIFIRPVELPLKASEDHKHKK